MISSFLLTCVHVVMSEFMGRMRVITCIPLGLIRGMVEIYEISNLVWTWTWTWTCMRAGME